MCCPSVRNVHVVRVATAWVRVATAWAWMIVVVMHMNHMGGTIMAIVTAIVAIVVSGIAAVVVSGVAMVVMVRVTVVMAVVGRSLMLSDMSHNRLGQMSRRVAWKKVARWWNTTQSPTHKNDQFQCSYGHILFLFFLIHFCQCLGSPCCRGNSTKSS